MWVAGLLIALALAILLRRWPPPIPMAWNGSPSSRAFWIRPRLALQDHPGLRVAGRLERSPGDHPGRALGHVDRFWGCVRRRSLAIGSFHQPRKRIMHVHFLDPYRPRPQPDPPARSAGQVRAGTGLHPDHCADADRRLAGLHPALCWHLSLSVALRAGHRLLCSKRAVLALPFVLAAFPMIFTVEEPAWLTCRSVPGR